MYQDKKHERAIAKAALIGFGVQVLMVAIWKVCITFQFDSNGSRFWSVKDQMQMSIELLL